MGPSSPSDILNRRQPISVGPAPFKRHPDRTFQWCWSHRNQLPPVQDIFWLDFLKGCQNQRFSQKWVRIANHVRQLASDIRDIEPRVILEHPSPTSAGARARSQPHTYANFWFWRENLWFSWFSGKTNVIFNSKKIEKTFVSKFFYFFLSLCRHAEFCFQRSEWPPTHRFL